MTFAALEGADRIAVQRGDVVVVVALVGDHDAFVECIRSLLAHTPNGVAMVIADDAGQDARSARFLAELDEAGVLEHPLHHLRSSESRGLARTLNAAFACVAPADVIVVRSDVVVTQGWFDALTAAAADSSLVATVSAFTNDGAFLSVPERNQPRSTLPPVIDPDAAAAAIGDGSLRLRPRIPTVLEHCYLVRRAALELAGPFDDGVEADFAQRCIALGLLHVVADDAFVARKPGGRPVDETPELVRDVRYPYYRDVLGDFEKDTSGPFARAHRAAEAALLGLTVSIDARCLTAIVTGTQVHTLEVIAALAKHEDVRVRAIVPHDLGAYARDVLDKLDVELLEAGAITTDTPRSHVVHRPMQVSSHDDLDLLARLGDRIVITHQDLIGYHNPSYFRSFEAWAEYRRLTRFALALADRVVFFSESAANDAIREDLIAPGSHDVVYIGTSHTLADVHGEERPPRGFEKVAGRPFLLCLGTDYAHKNRVFALSVLEQLREEQDWDGGLVFAGMHVATGSSSALEAGFLARRPQLSDAVVDVAAVSEEEKCWLLHNATLMLYPSVHEGFGLVPFEAADAGLVCAFAAQTAVAEILPADLALIEQWDAGATAANLMPYLVPGDQRDRHLAAVSAAGAELTWSRTADELAAVYRRASTGRSSESRALLEAFLEDRSALVESRSQVEQSYYAVRREYDKDAEGLVGPNGVIPSDTRQALLAVGSRPVLSRPVFGLIRWLYGLGNRSRRRRPPSPE